MIRYTTEDAWLITMQTHHALVSAYLAYHWGGAQFPRPEPWETLLIAVAQHDIGWHAWEAAPTLNEKGAPRDFLEMDLDEHLRIWQRGIEQAGRQGRFIALMVSCHFTYLYEGRRAHPDVATMLDEQAHVQTRLIEALGMSEQAVREAYRLVRLMDWFSLALALGRAEHAAVSLGSGPGGVPLTLHPLDQAAWLTVRPWPFVVDRLTVQMEAYRVPRHPFESNEAFRAALRNTPIVVREWHLVRTDEE